MRNGEYEGVEQVESDLNTMFDNARRYNVPNSAIYKRAQKLQQIMQVSIFLLFRWMEKSCLYIKHNLLLLYIDHTCQTCSLYSGITPMKVLIQPT